MKSCLGDSDSMKTQVPSPQACSQTQLPSDRVHTHTDSTTHSRNVLHRLSLCQSLNCPVYPSHQQSNESHFPLLQQHELLHMVPGDSDYSETQVPSPSETHVPSP